MFIITIFKNVKRDHLFYLFVFTYPVIWVDISFMHCLHEWISIYALEGLNILKFKTINIFNICLPLPNSILFQRKHIHVYSPILLSYNHFCFHYSFQITRLKTDPPIHLVLLLCLLKKVEVWYFFPSDINSPPFP